MLSDRITNLSSFFKPSMKRVGFTLLEVIVALTIFSSVGLAAFSWLNTSFISLERISKSHDRSEMVVNGLELLRNLNPTLQPDGSFETEHFDLSWQSEEFFEPTDHEKGLYTVAVYTVFATIEVQSSDEQIVFSFLQFGYEQQDYTKM